MLIGIHTINHDPMEDARVLTDIAEQVTRRGAEKIARVRIRELPREEGLPTVVLDVDVWPLRKQKGTINRFVQLQQIPVDSVPAYTFELARREASRNACPIHRHEVSVIQRVTKLANELTVDPEHGVSVFLLKSDNHDYAFLALDVHATDSALADYFRSFL